VRWGVRGRLPVMEEVHFADRSQFLISGRFPCGLRAGWQVTARRGFGRDCAVLCTECGWDEWRSDQVRRWGNDCRPFCGTKPIRGRWVGFVRQPGGSAGGDCAVLCTRMRWAGKTNPFGWLSCGVPAHSADCAEMCTVFARLRTRPGPSQARRTNDRLGSTAAFSSPGAAM
jgi:hypothetical protein